ncbi:MAG TPA: Crp/Fnr family transcriptional regulator [Saprospiraceae bacterium]|nr:Crp/Fnr family transcriptional regulator [Saprospiraceae bacterium]HMQ81280.1 Crp/Fnr family transcriptional regulator [Saprospiraceae bacterium]
MNLQATTSFLDQFPLFSVLSPTDKEALAGMMEYVIKPKYTFIYMPGDDSEEIYFLAKGSVKIGTHSSDGKEIIKSLVHPTAMFGEMGLVGEQSRSDFAQALKEDVHMYVLKVADMNKFMRTNFDLCASVMNLFGGRLLKAENKLESLIFKDARTRIIDFIKDSVNNRGRRIGYEMLLKHSLTHQDIANITCTSRQTVTLVLNELKKSDLIYFNRGKILVRDIAKLA